MVHMIGMSLMEYAQTLTYEGVSGHLATINSEEEAEIIFPY